MNKEEIYMKGSLVKPGIKNLLLSAVIILGLTFTMVGCNSQAVVEPEGLGDHVLDLGYENCFICHVGGQNPLAEHCTIALPDPVTLDNCLECHIDMRSIMLLPRQDAYIDNCKQCHLEFS